MVYNFLNEGAAINVFANQNEIDIKVVDAGVNHDFKPSSKLIDAKIAKGTKNYLHEPAMSEEQCSEAIDKGAEIVKEIQRQGCNIIGFGEMGIGKSYAALLAAHEYNHRTMIIAPRSALAQWTREEKNWPDLEGFKHQIIHTTYKSLHRYQDYLAAFIIFFVPSTFNK